MIAANCKRKLPFRRPIEAQRREKKLKGLFNGADLDCKERSKLRTASCLATLRFQFESRRLNLCFFFNRNQLYDSLKCLIYGSALVGAMVGVFASKAKTVGLKLKLKEKV